ncbi:MAG: NAD(P)-binding protein [Phycisphaera sp.]|nr:NAD(P)-binding protein [Phycisphaera sp.]
MGETAIVMGGGLAGIAAGVRLAERGVRVTLVETSRRMGGRASSHVDPDSGEQTDNCQHVVLKCCVNLLDLYQRLGVADRIEWHEVMHFLDKQGHRDRFARSWLPAPLHLGGSLGRFTTLDRHEKKAIERAMLAMMRLGAKGRANYTDVSFGHWLRRLGQPQRAIERFWEVVVVSACNESVDQCNAAYAMHVFQDAFMSHRDGYVMGTATVPLAQLYDPAEQLITDAGGEVRFGTSVRQIECEGSAVTGVTVGDDERLTADHYVSALPFDRLDKVVSDDMRVRDSRLQSLGVFRHSPIMGIHMLFESAVMDDPHVVFVDSPVQWVFNKGLTPLHQVGERLGEGDGSADASSSSSSAEQSSDSPSPQPSPSRERGNGQYLHLVISACDAWVDKPKDEILDMAVSELGAYLPKVKDAKLVRGRVIKEKRATFRAEPGIDQYRPRQVGATTNLYLAGDWTRSGWPATMEGAVRSGYLAAHAAGGGRGEALEPELPAALLYRMIGKLFPLRG